MFSRIVLDSLFEMNWIPKQLMLWCPVFHVAVVLFVFAGGLNQNDPLLQQELCSLANLNLAHGWEVNCEPLMPYGMLPKRSIWVGFTNRCHSWRTRNVSRIHSYRYHHGCNPHCHCLLFLPHDSITGYNNNTMVTMRWRRLHLPSLATTERIGKRNLPQAYTPQKHCYGTWQWTLLRCSSSKPPFFWVSSR